MEVPMSRRQFSLFLSAVLFLSCTLAAAGEWTVVRCPAADQDPLDRFEITQSLTGFEDGVGKWKALAGGQNAKASLTVAEDSKHGGSASLRVDCEYTGAKRLEYVEIAIGMEVPKPGLGLGLWAKGDGLPLGLRLRVQDKSGETHQFGLDRLSSGEWRFAAVAFNTRAGHWGGDKNGKLDYPCRIVSLVADRPHDGFKGKGSFWLDDISFVRKHKLAGNLIIETTTPALGNVFAPGTTVKLRARTPQGTVRWKTLDFHGRVIGQGNGPGKGTPIEFSAETPGHYACTIEALDKEKRLDARVFRCAALPPADPAKRNPFGGVCTHFQRASSWPPEGMDLLVRYGISEIRDEIPWAAVEREKGKYELPEAPAAFTIRAKEQGLNPLLIWCYGNRHYNKGGFPNDEETWQAYAKFCVAQAGLLRGRVKDYEVWNEWSVGCGMNGKPGSNKPEFYAPMILAAHKAVKEKFPDINIVGLGGEHSAHHFANMEVMLQKGAAKAMDCLSVHSYRYPRAPEESDLFGEIMKVADLAKKYKAPGRIWVTEIGWPTHLGGRGVDEPTQARYVVRTLALLQATGVVEKVHWYDFKNDGVDREYNESNFGLVWHQQYNWAPKPAVVAFSTFNRATAGAQCQGLTHRDGRYMVRYTRPDGSELLVAWTAKGEKPVAVTGRGRSAGRGRAVMDLLGATLGARADGKIVLSENPIYVSGRGLKIE